MSTYFEYDALNRVLCQKEKIEDLVTHGDEAVQTAATTGFLELLVNCVSKEISTDSFTPFLGENSRAYCQAYEDFTGGKHQYNPGQKKEDRA